MITLLKIMWNILISTTIELTIITDRFYLSFFSSEGSDENFKKEIRRKRKRFLD
jgi:hypothetical protein